MPSLIGSFAATGDWSQLAVYLPMGILFGAVHALTPGHGKAVLATYLAGSTASVSRALATSLALSFTHVRMSVLIVLLSLPLIRFGFGAEAGRAPALEHISRGLLVAVGIWMIVRAFRSKPSHADHASPAVVVASRPRLLERTGQFTQGVGGALLLALALGSLLS